MLPQRQNSHCPRHQSDAYDQRDKARIDEIWMVEEGSHL